MRVAYIQIKVEPGQVEKVASDLIEIESVTEVYSISGEYDILAKVIMDSLDDASEIIPNVVHKIKGLRETNTLFTFSAFK